MYAGQIPSDVQVEHVHLTDPSNVSMEHGHLLASLKCLSGTCTPEWKTQMFFVNRYTHRHPADVQVEHVQPPNFSQMFNRNMVTRAEGPNVRVEHVHLPVVIPKFERNMDSCRLPTNVQVEHAPDGSTEKIKWNMVTRRRPSNVPVEHVHLPQSLQMFNWIMNTWQSPSKCSSGTWTPGGSLPNVQVEHGHR